jgi:hypothetical protein
MSNRWFLIFSTTSFFSIPNNLIVQLISYHFNILKRMRHAKHPFSVSAILSRKARKLKTSKFNLSNCNRQFNGIWDTTFQLKISSIDDITEKTENYVCWQVTKNRLSNQFLILWLNVTIISDTLHTNLFRDFNYSLTLAELCWHWQFHTTDDFRETSALVSARSARYKI